MSLFSRILLLAIVFSLTGCGENIEPLAPQEDYATSAMGKKELVLYATPSIDGEPHAMFDINLYAPSGSDFSIDWGDGTSDNYSSVNGYIHFEKGYDAAGRYKVTITGDLEQITSLRLVYGWAATDSIDVSALRNLEDLMVALTVSPKVIDISRNRKLRSAIFESTDELTQVILPVRHSITSFSIAGPNKMTTAEVDYVINNIYTNAVKGNIHDGFLSVMKEIFVDEGSEFYGEMVGPPSPSSVTKLKTLQDVYGWYVTPIQY
jgi:hypothetical protein